MIDNFKVNSRFRPFLNLIIFNAKLDLVYFHVICLMKLALGMRAMLISKYVHLEVAENSPLHPFVAVVGGIYILPRV